MATLISVLIILVCIFLILIVLVQNSKGGGLASSFSSSNQVMGVRKTADFLEKATWTLAVALLSLSLISAAYNKPTEGQQNGKDNQSVTRNHDAAAGDNTGGSTNSTAPTKTNGAPTTTAPIKQTVPPTKP